MDRVRPWIVLQHRLCSRAHRAFASFHQYILVMHAVAMPTSRCLAAEAQKMDRSGEGGAEKPGKTHTDTSTSPSFFFFTAYFVIVLPHRPECPVLVAVLHSSLPAIPREIQPISPMTGSESVIYTFVTRCQCWWSVDQCAALWPLMMTTESLLLVQHAVARIQAETT